jgi:hypothetical protein
MIWAFEVDTDRRFRALVLRPGPGARASAAADRRTVYFMPPYILTDDEFALLARAPSR